MNITFFDFVGNQRLFEMIHTKLFMPYFGLLR